MKLIISQALLLKTLTHVQSAVGRRNTIPILSNVLIDVSEGNLALTATDMDLTIVDAVPVEMEEPGVITAPVHTLYDIVRKLPEGAQVKISTGADGSKLKIKAGRSVFTLATLPKADFPSSGSANLPHKFTLQSSELRNLIDRTRFAISTEETRYYMKGIYLHAANDVLRAVATDGHRLARFEMPLPEGAGDMPGVIVPSKTVSELHKLVDETDQPVDVALSDTKIRFSLDSTVLSSKLIDGTFPDYQRVIPVGNDKIVKVNCRDFADAVDRVSTISSEKSRAVKLVIEDDILRLSTTSPEGGSATEDVPISYTGPQIEIGFNSGYLLDIARQIEGESAEISLADSSSSVVVNDASDSSALYVLMPMRI